ncbi:MAG: hypothetical protein A2W79_08275 [Pseudomonadales bacterium RIFCSPLOWO2_12_60_38]|uniref:hypothetical protein n=1 Tax=Pseudomonas TaxID=286 RepID=UPI0003DC8025|nr:MULTISPECIES: hypothetical protein [unclassified Pseudomonas]ETK40989.1 hypothetical protein H098_14560 [Pseudomonas fluorescens FH5]OHC33501.1 MAG: hypothetical protein A2W79_08275 [Pseudomonadales bacterium RIFCSPLOWO2_12_60_38]OHC40595.1 MAG: hypothetical protein A3G72_15750 [Pseudomonadales bacterium RIFCSPLOWO2_12_FULL_59_450]PTT11584.1 hypothetical protein DBR14_13275 [Pseudomonas sp. HMWF034]PVV78143.1 hypothetical protein DD985_01755 [Pseudomonas sp. HMWF011]
MTVISNSRFSELYTPQLSSAVPQPQSARLEVATELPGTRQTSLQDKDQWLASIYGGTLRDLLGDNQDYREVEVDRIPWNSSLGQTRALMLKLLESPAFKDWAKQNDVDLSKPLTINVDSGTLDVTTTGAKQRNPFDFSPPTPTAKSLDIHSFTGWPLLKSVAKTLAGPGNVVSFDTASTATTATIADIARFHGHAVPSDRILSPSQRQASIQQLLDKLQDPDSDTYNERFNFPPQQYLNNQVSELGDLNNRNAVIGVISNVVNEKAKDLEDLEAELQFWQKRSGYEETIEKLQLTIKQRLQNVLDTPVEIDPTSSYFRDHNLKPDVAVTLRDYLVGHGIVLPTNASELKNIAQSLASPPIEKPAHGNLGGAHSWPTPMSNDDRRALAAMTSKFLEGQPENTLLAYLTRGVEYRQNFGASFLEDRSRGIDNVLEFPNVKKFALAAEREFGEIASPNVIADWMLTALYDALDPLSINATSPDSNRTKVAGFDLANMNLSGMNAQDIYATLSDHLRETGVTNHYNGVLAMEVLLARKAPELLVKDIPETLTKGTHSWVSFVTAVARIEAEAPGSTSRMTYAQVMMRHELAPITLADKLVEQQAQTDALKDWGVYNGVLTRSSTDQYSEEDMTKVRAAFNEQMHQLNESSKTFATPFPVLHEMAVASIKEQNPHLSEEQIKRKVLTPKDSGFLEFPGPYSLVDILINAERHHKDVALDSYTSSDKDIDLSTIALRKFTNSSVVYTFETQLSVLFDRFERATQTQVKNLISKLPIEDRKIIEHGKVTISKEVDVSYEAYSQVQKRKDSSPTSIFLQSEFVDAQGNKGTHTYEIDSAKNTIRKRIDLNDKIPGAISDDKINSKRLVPLAPDGNYSDNVLTAGSTDAVNDAPNSFASEKTQYIADAMVKKISIRDNAESLRGTTAFDGEVPFWQKIEDFVVGLIPGYNAVKNFIAGNWREGLIDVAFDVFGFLLAGAGGAVRAAGAGARAGSSAFGSTAKRLVRGAIGALNPIDPKGIAQGFVQEGITYLANSGPGRNNQPSFKIKYDPVKIFRNVENATIGNANMQGTTTAIAATQKNGKWYALDPVSKQPFGLPLKDFVPSA